MRDCPRPVMITGVIVGCVVIVVGLIYGCLSFNARRVFNAQASALTKRHVEARSVRAEFPAGLVVEGLSVEGVLECPRVRVAMDILSFFGRETRIRMIELDRPVVVWERMAPVSGGSPSSVTLSGDVAATSAPHVGAAKPIILTELAINDGTLKIIVKNSAGEPREYGVEQVRLRAKDVPLTEASVRTDFSLTASLIKIKVPFAGHLLKAEGWLNWAARDMDATARVMDDDGYAGLEVKLVSLRNDMKVSGTFSIAGKNNSSPEHKKSRRVEDIVLGLLASTGKDIRAGFSFGTKMDDINLEAAGLSGDITTGLNSSPTSGNIVAGLEPASAGAVQDPKSVDTYK
jgi:hypothetical protein